MKVLSAPDVDWRSIIFQAVISKGVHGFMVKASWLMDDEEGDRGDISDNALVGEVDRFLAGSIGQGSALGREMLVGALKVRDIPPDPGMCSEKITREIF
jgi:hypothetical protein